MTEPVLTDDEKGALLEGMSSGEVEVRSRKGPVYAEVKAFEIGPRSTISTASYPRLRDINLQSASQLTKRVEVLLNADASVTYVGTVTCTFGEACEKNQGLSLFVEFSPRPLQGSALISLGASTVGNLVETFFGGKDNDPTTHEPESFTPGETSVATLFGEAVLKTIADAWEPLEKVAPEIIGMHVSSALIDNVGAGDPVINSEFMLEFGDQQQVFHVLWPLRTVAALIPALEGQKRERDAAEDARWGRTLRAAVTDAVVTISSSVGRTRMSLGAVAELEAGDVISIGNPRSGIVSARDIPILDGRFGVHDGRYAIEAVNWLTSGAPAPAAKSL